MIARLLAHGLAHAHPHGALHLAFHGQAIERLAAVVRHPDLVHIHDAGVLVHAHFHHLRRIAVAHGAADGGAAIFPAAVRFRDGGIVSGHRNGAGVLERLGDHFAERQPHVLGAGAIDFTEALDLFRLGLQLARRRRDEHALEIVRRLDGGIADHERHARGIGAVVLGHDLAVAGDDADARKLEPEHFANRLRQQRRRALADLGCAREHDNGAVEVELDLHCGMRLAGPVHGL